MENEYLNIFGISSIIIWMLILCCFINMKLWQKRLAKKINVQWIKNYERTTKRPISELIAGLEKSISSLRKITKVLIAFMILDSLSFLVECLYPGAYNATTLYGIVLAGISIPAWLFFGFFVTMLDDKRKRLVEVMKENHA